MCVTIAYSAYTLQKIKTINEILIKSDEATIKKETSQREEQLVVFATNYSTLLARFFSSLISVCFS